ncbi:hypothetical protein PYJP_09710 [Pyrofollis japonicus]|uniref:60S ribosomal export protein NMD3 n=1 Tax=Pyrofollis japonicus TaxID=3060460 RepID=UPI00295AA9FA|nr:60S ribosomal export protein NMD3 [Pyrofollis japonicus]BEP17619.1 hypothetical protein PYJP_09710 [Pyrofollis japonicus]
MARLVCARCGKELKPGAHVGALCLDCFLETTQLLCIPKRIEFDYCKYCGSIRIGYKWVEGGELGDAARRYLEWYVANQVKPCTPLVISYKLEEITPHTIPSWRTVYELTFSFVIKDVDDVVRQTYNVEIYAKPTVCPLCKESRSGDYDVVVQLRGMPPRKLAEALSSLFETSRQVVSSIIDIVELKNGADIYLSDRGSASKIIKELRKKFEVNILRTSEDVGVSSTGLRRRRMIYSVRLSMKRRRTG